MEDEKVKKFLNNSNIKNQNDTNMLLELAELIREILKEDNIDYIMIGNIINIMLKNQNIEAINWIILTIQENTKILCKDIIITLGKKIEFYDKFIKSIGIDETPIHNMSIDKSIDIQEYSLLNINIYSTKYEYLYLFVIESFNTLDKDFVEYKLIFTSDINMFCKDIKIIN